MNELINSINYKAYSIKMEQTETEIMKRARGREREQEGTGKRGINWYTGIGTRD